MCVCVSGRISNGNECLPRVYYSGGGSGIRRRWQCRRGGDDEYEEVRNDDDDNDVEGDTEKFYKLYIVT